MPVPKRGAQGDALKAIRGNSSLADQAIPADPAVTMAAKNSITAHRRRQSKKYRCWACGEEHADSAAYVDHLCFDQDCRRGHIDSEGGVVHFYGRRLLKGTPCMVSDLAQNDFTVTGVTPQGERIDLMRGTKKACEQWLAERLAVPGKENAT